MTKPNEKYTVGNIVAIVVAILMGLGLAFYAIFGEDTGRIGRGWLGFAVSGLVGAAICGWYLIKALRSRRG